MNKILSLIFLLLTFLPFKAQTISLASPIYLGSLLIDEPDTALMARTCRQYNLSEQPAEGDYKVFTYADGTKFRFKVEKTDQGNLPTVEIKTTESAKTIKKALSDTGFRKTPDGYEKGSSYTPRITKCQVSTGTPKVITLTKTL